MIFYLFCFGCLKTISICFVGLKLFETFRTISRNLFLSLVVALIFQIEARMHARVSSVKARVKVESRRK